MGKILSKNKPEKSLLRPLKKTGGRSNSGRITVRHKGGGAKRQYRLVDFGQFKIPFKVKVVSIEYDPNRTAYIALVAAEDGEKYYILAPQGLNPGMEIIYDKRVEIAPGNRMEIGNIPVGVFVYNVELEPGRGGKIARSAGSSAEVMGYEGNYVQIRMPSGELRKALKSCFASIGELSNPQHRFEEIGKAGRSRYLGIRPTVRGSAMNACDHPHGGGKNKVSIGLKYPKTPWGKPALGVKTRKKKWTDRLIIQRRQKKK